MIDIPIIVAILALAGLICFILETGHGPLSRKMFLLGVCSFATLLASVFSGLFFEYPTSKLNDGFVIFARDNETGQFKEAPYGVFEWQEYVKVPDFASGTLWIRMPHGQVTPITENPKARRICFEGTPKVTDVGKFLSKPEREAARHNPARVAGLIKRTVEFHFYNFNEWRSKELARFYNPLDPKQQKGFQELLGPWVNERLEDEGIEVHDLHFWLE